jgi:DeoR family suf operon transcriptional repressor
MPKNARKQRKPVALVSLPGTVSLLGTARGQILSELCGHRLTALELAERFSVSSNAVRTHLTALESDRLVRHAAETRGVGKPTHVYELTPEGQYLLSRAYAPALAYVLRAVQNRIPGRLDDTLRDAGRDLAAARIPSASKRSSLRTRAEECAEILRSLGGSAEVTKESEGLVIRSECCPLAIVVAEHPSSCKLFEGMAREVTGRSVREQCDRQRRPHCRFIIS